MPQNSGFSLVPAAPSTEEHQVTTRAGSGRVALLVDPAFPPSGGRPLGSGPVRRTADRAAVLAAAERRAMQQQEGADLV